jgi:hypothetical protein
MSFDFLTIVVIVNALATFVLWSERRPQKIKKKFRKQLYDTKPITPKHRPPKAIGGRFESCVRKEHRVFFADFADFANVVNWSLADEHVQSRWRLQELSETELRLHGVFDYGPTFGRSYAVFYNQVRLGTLEVEPRFRYSADDPCVITYIHLDHVRLLSFETIRDFFAAIAEHACYDSPGGKEYFEAQQAIDRAMTEALWRSNEVDVHNNMLDRIEGINAFDYGEIDLRLDGVARWYLERREALRKQDKIPSLS